MPCTTTPLSPIRSVWSSLANSFLPDSSSYSFYRWLAGLQSRQSRQVCFLQTEGEACHKLGSLHLMPALFPSKYSQRLSSSCLSTNYKEAWGGGVCEKWQEEASGHSKNFSSFATEDLQGIEKFSVFYRRMWHVLPTLQFIRHIHMHTCTQTDHI